MQESSDIFKPSYPITKTIRGKIYNSQQAIEELFPVMQGMVVYANELMRTLLIMRGEKYTLDGISFSEDDVRKQLRAICSEHGIRESFSKVQSMAREVYEAFLYRTDKNGDKKCNSNARTYVGVMLSPTNPDNPDQPKIPEECPSMAFFRKKGIFPIRVNGKTMESAALKFSLAQDVLTKLTSMVEIQKEYDEKRKTWEKVLQDLGVKLEKLERYEEFLSVVRNIPEYSQFNNDGYRRFLRSWRGPRDDNKAIIFEKGMRHHFLRTLANDPSHVFSEADKYLFGYNAQFMNTIFNDFRDLWEHEDILGSQRKELKGQDYVDAVYNNYHWLKDSIGISSFGKNGKVCHIHMGNNFAKFTLTKEGDRWVVGVQNVNGGKEYHRLEICHCPQFDSMTTKIVNLEKSDGSPAKTETIQVRYAADSKQKTWETGNLSQPTLRYSVEKKCLFIDFAISDSKVEGILSDSILSSSKEMFKLKGAFSAAMPCNDRQKDKSTSPVDKLRVMGVDLGMVVPIQATIYDVEIKNGKAEGHQIKSLRSPQNENYTEQIQKITSLRSRMNGMRHLIDQTVLYVAGEIDAVPEVVRGKNWSTNIAESLGIDMNEYNMFLSDAKGKMKAEDLFWWIRKQESQWLALPIMRKLREEITEMKTAFFRCKTAEEKRNHCQNRNHVDHSVFMKKAMVDDWISLTRSFSTFGLSTEESIRIRRNNLSAKDRKWRKGLARKCSSLASLIINMARENGAILVFIEDLDCRPSAFDSKEDNNLKKLLGWGELKKWLGHQARKHNIGVIPIDPHLTSRIHSETGLLGIIHGRDLYVFKPNRQVIVVNRDENADDNIAIRGITRHLDLREFRAVRIGENRYRVVARVEDGAKRKAGALFHRVGSTECVFVRENDGTLRVETNAPCKTDMEAAGIGDKSCFVILHGDTWRLRHELEEELTAKLEKYLSKRSRSRKSKSRNRETCQI